MGAGGALATREGPVSSLGETREGVVRRFAVCLEGGWSLGHCHPRLLIDDVHEPSREERPVIAERDRRDLSDVLELSGRADSTSPHDVPTDSYGGQRTTVSG